MSWLLLALLACKQDATYGGAFDLPSATAVLPVLDGPFTDPVGYVADRNGGRVTPLDLRLGIFLPDPSGASFGAASPIALGRSRIITDLAPWSNGDQVDVFAADQAFQVLVRASHVVGADSTGRPLRPDTTWELIEAGAGLALEAVTVTPGTTSTEDWTLTRVADGWSLSGSRSGKLAELAQSGVPYEAAEIGLSFTLTGDAEPGATLRFHTESGLVEYPLGGAPEHLALAPDGSRLAVLWHDEAVGHSVFGWFDPVSEQLSAPVLPADAQPAQVVFAGTSLFAVDGAAPVLWEVDASDAVKAHPLPGPGIDVAVLTDGLAYVLAADARTLYAIDPATDALVDINAAVAGVQSLRLDAPVSGIDAVDMEHDWVELNSAGDPLRGRSVAASLANGTVTFIEADTSCLLQDLSGPHAISTSSSSSSDFATSIPGYRAADGYPYFVTNPITGNHIEVPPCAGLTRAETWTVTYRQHLSGWEVEGTLSGLQQHVAYANQRYLSDEGVVSFTLREGSLLPEEGWAFSFSTVPGALVADGSNQSSSASTSLSLPADPVYFSATDATGEAHPYVLVASQGADMVATIAPGSALVTAEWW